MTPVVWLLGKLPNRNYSRLSLLKSLSGLGVGFSDRVEPLGLECIRFEYSRKIAVVCEEMDAPRQLSNKRLGVRVGSRSACCPAGVCDDLCVPNIRFSMDA